MPLIYDILNFIDKKNLWGDIIKLIGGLFAFYAVIWTQRRLNDRSEREAQHRLTQMKLEHKQQEKMKTIESRLKKIEEIFKLTKQIRDLYVKASIYLEKENENLEDTAIYAYLDDKQLELVSLRSEVQLLCEIYLPDTNLLNDWIENSDIVSDVIAPCGYNDDTERLISDRIHRINTIIDNLSKCAHNLYT